MRRNGKALALAATCLLVTACAAKRLPPSQAVLEARQRAATADSRVKCAPVGAEVGVPFAYGAAELSDVAKAAMDLAVTWTKCTPGAQVVVIVDPEYHHRLPEKEKAIFAGRNGAIRDYLSARLAAGVLLADGAAADPARPSVILRGRGW